jgi:hypothetical protein
MVDLATVFNDGDPVAEVETPVVEEVTETPATEEKTDETETPETVAKEEVSTTEPKTEPEQTMVPMAGLKAERVKRQALEKQVQEFEANKAKTPAPDIFENQEAYTSHMTQKFDKAMFNERANQSEFFARREFKDLDSKVEQYQALLADNPSLGGQVQSAVSPYHEIVDIVDRHEKMARMENIDDFEAKTRAEIEVKVRAEIKAEMEGKADASQKTRDSIPTSLVGESSKGGIGKTPPPGNSTLSKIFND